VEEFEMELGQLKDLVRQAALLNIRFYASVLNIWRDLLHALRVAVHSEDVREACVILAYVHEAMMGLVVSNRGAALSSGLTNKTISMQPQISARCRTAPLRLRPPHHQRLFQGSIHATIQSANCVTMRRRSLRTLAYWTKGRCEPASHQSADDD
jgi:hypothetical protein